MFRPFLRIQETWVWRKLDLFLCNMDGQPPYTLNFLNSVQEQISAHKRQHHLLFPSATGCWFFGTFSFKCGRRLMRSAFVLTELRGKLTCPAKERDFFAIFIPPFNYGSNTLWISWKKKFCLRKLFATFWGRNHLSNFFFTVKVVGGWWKCLTRDSVVFRVKSAIWTGGDVFRKKISPVYCCHITRGRSKHFRIVLKKIVTVDHGFDF